MSKYYLREDRKAVQPEMNEPEWPGFYESDPTVIQYYEHKQLLWLDHIKSLPALDVDPDYLKRLSPGWFEGEEEYRITSTKGWVKTHKAMYDRFPDIQKQILIVAPQPVAEKAGMRWVKASERLPQAGKPFFIRSVHTKSGGMMWGEEIGKMEELENVEWLDEQPATPQPVTGEAAKDVLMRHIPKDCYWEEMGNLINCPEMYIIAAMDEYQAASRPSDAVEFGDLIEDAVNAYFHQAEKELGRKDLGYIEERNWQKIKNDCQRFFTNSKSPNPNK